MVGDLEHIALERLAAFDHIVFGYLCGVRCEQDAASIGIQTEYQRARIAVFRSVNLGGIRTGTEIREHGTAVHLDRVTDIGKCRLRTARKHRAEKPAEGLGRDDDVRHVDGVDRNVVQDIDQTADVVVVRMSRDNRGQVIDAECIQFFDQLLARAARSAVDQNGV